MDCGVVRRHTGTRGRHGRPHDGPRTSPLTCASASSARSSPYACPTARGDVCRPLHIRIPLLVKHSWLVGVALFAFGTVGCAGGSSSSVVAPQVSRQTRDCIQRTPNVATRRTDAIATPSPLDNCDPSPPSYPGAPPAPGNGPCTQAVIRPGAPTPMVNPCTGLPPPCDPTVQTCPPTIVACKGTPQSCAGVPCSASPETINDLIPGAKGGDVLVNDINALWIKDGNTNYTWGWMYLGSDGVRYVQVNYANKAAWSAGVSAAIYKILGISAGVNSPGGYSGLTPWNGMLPPGSYPKKCETQGSTLV